MSIEGLLETNNQRNIKISPSATEDTQGSQYVFSLIAVFISICQMPRPMHPLGVMEVSLPKLAWPWSSVNSKLKSLTPRSV